MARGGVEAEIDDQLTLDYEGGRGKEPKEQ